MFKVGDLKYILIFDKGFGVEGCLIIQEGDSLKKEISKFKSEQIKALYKLGKKQKISYNITVEDIES